MFCVLWSACKCTLPPLICYLMPSFPVIEPLCPISPEKKEGDQLSQDLAQWSRCASTRYKVQDTMVQMCIVQLWQFQSLSPISWDEGLDHQFTLIQNRPFALTRIQPCCPISWKQQQLVRIWLTIGPSAFANIYIQGSSQPAGGVHISSESDVIPACQVYSSL